MQSLRSPSSVSASPLNILVVDDNHDSAKSLSLLMIAMGNRVRVAHDGIEALLAVREFHPNIVLLDIGLPRLSGYDVARRIRQEPSGADVIIIAVTGWGQPENKEESREAGFDYHLVKPVDPVALAELVRKTGSKAL